MTKFDDDYKNSDEYHDWKQAEYEREQYEAHHNALLEKCTHSQQLVYVETAYEDNSTQYYANYECKQCDLWHRHRIDHDDFLYHKNRGVDLR